MVDNFAPSKTNRFVGICIDRGDYGLKAWFILRNHVDGLGAFNLTFVCFQIFFAFIYQAIYVSLVFLEMREYVEDL